MAQLFQKPYECLGCGQQIRISKIDNVPAGQKKKWDKFELDGVTPQICHQHKQQQLQPQQHYDLSKEIMTIKAQLLAVVNRLDYIEKLMMKLMMKKQPLEQVIYEKAQELAHERNWSVSFTLSVMWSRFKSAGDTKEAEMAFILMQREEERKGKGDPIFTEW